MHTVQSHTHVDTKTFKTQKLEASRSTGYRWAYVCVWVLHSIAEVIHRGLKYIFVSNRLQLCSQQLRNTVW